MPFCCLLIIACVVFKYYPYINLSNSRSLPRPSDNFIGRDEEVKNITQLLDHKRIVNIFGSPGFGKSTLAIHVGHHMIMEGKVTVVHYINLDDNPKEGSGVKQFLVEKIYRSSDKQYETASFDKFLQWIRGWNFHNLIILDNCDESLHHQKEELQIAVEKVVENSDLVNFLMTSREVTLYVGNFEQFKLNELSTEDACDLLQRMVPSGKHLTSSEKETLANLTGNVPLALHIVSSLWRLPNLAVIKNLIEELEEQLILTLSPEQLPLNRQINASFSLSYKYLSSEEKLIGQLISNFPGSFTEESCVAILQSISLAEKSIKAALAVMLQRSLLEYNSDNQRYHFHSLIREYFLERQKESNTALNFTISFQDHFFHVLSNTSAAYGNPSFEKSLAVLDKEWHNFLRVFEDLKTRKIIECPLRSFAVTAVSVAVDCGLLMCRFSRIDLLQLINDAIAYFNVETITLSSLCTETVDAFLKLLYHEINFQEMVNSSEIALDVFENHTAKIKAMDIENSNITLYVRVLKLVSQHYSDLGKHDDAKHYFSLVIKYSRKKLLECNSSACSYRDIGLYHENAEEYKQAAHFLKKSLEVEIENYTLLKSLHTMYILHQVYIKIDHTVDANIVFENITSLLPEVSKLPSISIFQNIGQINDIILLLHQNNEVKAADILKFHVIRAIKDISPESNLGMLDPAKLHDTVLFLYMDKNYSEAIEIGAYAFKNKPQNLTTEFNVSSIRLLFIVAKSKILCGNFSDGWDDLEDVLESIIRLSYYNKTSKEYWYSCFILIPRLSYVNTCFWSPLSRYFWYPLSSCGRLLWVIIKWVLVLPFNVYSTTTQEVSHVPKLTHLKLSSSKEIIAGNGFNLQAISVAQEEIILFLQQLWVHICKCCELLINSQLFLFNIVIILIRIIFVVGVLRFVINLISSHTSFTYFLKFVMKIYLSFLLNKYLRYVIVTLVYVNEICFNFFFILSRFFAYICNVLICIILNLCLTVYCVQEFGYH